MDIIFDNFALLKILAIGLFNLDISKTDGNKNELLLKLTYHIYNVHQSNKCFLSNILFPKSKQTCDELLLDLMEGEDKTSIVIVEQLLNKIYNEPFDRDIDAVDVAIKTFSQLNQYCKIQQQKEEPEDLSQEKFNRCPDITKESILYKCINHTERQKYFHKKKIKEEYRQEMNKLFEDLEVKCPNNVFEKITKKKKFEPVIYQIKQKYGNELLLACRQQKDKMEFVLGLIQKLYL